MKILIEKRERESGEIRYGGRKLTETDMPGKERQYSSFDFVMDLYRAYVAAILNSPLNGRFIDVQDGFWLKHYLA